MKYAQIFRYELTLDKEGYQNRWVAPYAKAISQVPGLIRKTWMANFETGEFASVYLWQNRSAMEAFMASPAIAQVAAEPFLKNLSIVAMPVLEDASAITHDH